MSLDPRCGVVQHACHDTDTEAEEGLHAGGVVRWQKEIRYGETPSEQRFRSCDVMIVGGSGHSQIGLELAYKLARQEPVPILVLDSPPCQPTWPRDLNFTFKPEPGAMKAARNFFKRPARKRRR